MQPSNLSSRDAAANALPRSADQAAVMRRFIDAVINKGDFALLHELLHPDYRYRAPDRELHGAQAVQALFAAYRAAFPDLHISIDELLSAGDQAVVAFTLTGTHAGELTGIAATARRVRVNGMVLGRFQDGRLIEEWEILDQLSLLQQLGVAAHPPSTHTG